MLSPRALLTFFLVIVGAAGARAQEVPAPPPSDEPVYVAPRTVPEPPSGTPDVPAQYRLERPSSRYPLATEVPGGLEEIEQQDVNIPSRIATRLRVLERNLQSLAGGSNAVLDGVLSFLTGGLFISIGVLSDDQRYSPYLYVYGGASIARGIVELAVVPNTNEVAIAYANMPMSTVREVKDRLRFGERSLEYLSDRSGLARILESTINIASGIAVVPLYLGPNDFEVRQPIDVFVVIGAGISVVSGLISLVTPTDAERRWDAYSELRRRQAEDRRRARARRPAPAAASTSP